MPSDPTSPRRSLGKIACALAIVGGALAGSAAWARATLPQPHEVADGVRLEGEALPHGARARESVVRAANAKLDAPIRFVHAGEVLFTATPRELGARIDAERAVADALRPGRDPDWIARLGSARAARGGAYDVRLVAEMPVSAIAARLVDAKEEHDRAPRGARIDADAKSVTPHVDGRYLDAFATAESALHAMREGRGEVAVSVLGSVPSASTKAAEALDHGVELARWETRFGGPPGRDKNIARAASALDGVVLMPGEEISFNAEVGPRSTQNGFFPAPEIYRGESREGIGGGVCQVASTLYAATLFAGLDVTERQNHSRPSAYIRPGLDATVSYPVLDLRLRNPFDFPVVLDTSIARGGLVARVLGKAKPTTVDLATETSGVFKFKRKIERAGWLAEGKSKLKQKGKNGMSIRRTIRMHDATGKEQVVVTTDVYPATQEIWLLAPGADPETTLPPFGEPPAPAPSAPGGGPA
jgi:vancomycin resistance protein YoaR